MYESYYGLREKPFSLTPNPRFVYYSEHYRTALGHLLYGIEQREGFLLLTGVVGTGKTTLCRELLENLDGPGYRTALLFNPFLSGPEVLQALLGEFGCPFPPDANRRELLDVLNCFLLAQLVEGRTCVAIFDEAQHLSAEILEQIRVLSNLETDREKLLQIVLVGQPELRDRIQQPALAQLDQRVSLRCTLRDMNRDETGRYLHHRLGVAGAPGDVRFTGRAVALVHRASYGVPRLVNLACDRALLAGYAAQSRRIGARHVRRGLASLRGEEPESRPAPSLVKGRSGHLRLAAGLATLAAVALGIGAAWYAGLVR
jgi:general secretion pathway protein A